MGKASAAYKAFIESIPDARLTGFTDPKPTYTIWHNIDFRLDCQNVRGHFFADIFKSHVFFGLLTCQLTSF
jgi:hypothetical protein